MFDRIVLVALAAGLALPPRSMAADSVSLAEAQRLAVARSSQVVARDAAVEASRNMAVAAGRLPDPMLRAGIDNVPVNGPDRFSLGNDFMTMRRVGIMQELTRGEKRRLRAERFEREADKSLAEKHATIAALQRDSALAWLDRYYAEAMGRLIDEQVAQSRLEVEAAEAAYRAGRGSQADVFGAQSMLASMQDRAAEYRRRIAVAKIALARWIGEAAQAPLAGSPDLSSIRIHEGGNLEAHLASHPMIEMLSRQEDIAQVEANLARADKKPDWSVELMYANRGSAFSDMVSIGVSVPLPWDQKNRQDRELAAKLAMREQARATREDALRAHVAEVQAMIAEWRDDRERMGRYRGELVPLARERTQAAAAAYRGGKSMLMDVMAARRNEIEVRVQALQLEMEAARMWAQLNFLVPDDSLLPASVATFHGEPR